MASPAAFKSAICSAGTLARSISLVLSIATVVLISGTSAHGESLEFRDHPPVAVQGLKLVVRPELALHQLIGARAYRFLRGYCLHQLSLRISWKQFPDSTPPLPRENAVKKVGAGFLK